MHDNIADLEHSQDGYSKGNTKTPYRCFEEDAEKYQLKNWNFKSYMLFFVLF